MTFLDKHLDARRRPIRFAVAWGVAGLVATLTGEAEMLVAEGFVGADGASAGRLVMLVNVLFWWSLSGAFRGWMSAVALRGTVEATRTMSTWRVCTVFAVLWLSMGLLHHVIGDALEPGERPVLLLPMLAIGLVLGRVTNPGSGWWRKRSFWLRVGGWTGGWAAFLLLLSATDRLWAALGWPHEGAGAIALGGLVSVLCWSAYGALGSALAGWAVSRSQPPSRG